MKPRHETLGLLTALVAITLGVNGVPEDEAFRLAYALGREYGGTAPTEESVKDIIRRAKELRRAELLKRVPDAGMAKEAP